MNFGDQKPKLKEVVIHTDGSKMIIHSDVTGTQAVLSLDQKSLLPLLDGKKNLKQILSSLYGKGERVSFRALFEALDQLSQQDLLENYEQSTELSQGTQPFYEAGRIFKSLYEKSHF